MFYLLTLFPLPHTMDLQPNGQQGRDSKCSSDFSRSWTTDPQGVLRKVVTTFRAPKVQTWIRRNQAKLSGKRTLSPNNSGKFPSWDTDGVNLVGLVVG